VVLVVVVQLAVVAAVKAHSRRSTPAAAKAAVVAVVAAPSVVGATLRSSFQLGRGTSNRLRGSLVPSVGTGEHNRSPLAGMRSSMERGVSGTQ
jgi:hypothetical protein